MAIRYLPPLLTDELYRTPGLASFEFIGKEKAGANAIVRIRLPNRILIDVAADDEQLLHFRRAMIAAFPDSPVAPLKKKSSR
jgi:hypothetical protein